MKRAYILRFSSEISPEKTKVVGPVTQTPSSCQLTKRFPPSKSTLTMPVVRASLFDATATAHAEELDASVTPDPLSQTFTLIVEGSIISAI